MRAGLGGTQPLGGLRFLICKSESKQRCPQQEAGRGLKGVRPAEFSLSRAAFRAVNAGPSSQPSLTFRVALLPPVQEPPTSPQTHVDKGVRLPTDVGYGEGRACQAVRCGVPMASMGLAPTRAQAACLTCIHCLPAPLLALPTSLQDLPPSLESHIGNVPCHYTIAMGHSAHCRMCRVSNRLEALAWPSPSCVGSQSPRRSQSQEEAPMPVTLVPPR